MLTICIDNLENSPSNYRLVTFPTRVKINAVSFSINSEAAGTIEQDRSWGLSAMVGSPDPQDGNPRNEWINPLFPDEKPVIHTPEQYLGSTIVVPPVFKGTKNDGTAADLALGIMAPGDYIALWINTISGDFEGIEWENTSAVITLDYELTANRSAKELVKQFPEFD